jgi:tetratricopeptide (TPR) repeat protein
LIGSTRGKALAYSANPNYGEVYNNRDLVRYQGGDLQGAIGDFKEAIGLNPNDGDAYYDRGLVYSE